MIYKALLILAASLLFISCQLKIQEGSKYCSLLIPIGGGFVGYEIEVQKTIAPDKWQVKEKPILTKYFTDDKFTVLITLMSDIDEIKPLRQQREHLANSTRTNVLNRDQFKTKYPRVSQSSCSSIQKVKLDDENKSKSIMSSFQEKVKARTAKKRDVITDPAGPSIIFIIDSGGYGIKVGKYEVLIPMVSGSYDYDQLVQRLFQIKQAYPDRKTTQLFIKNNKINDQAIRKSKELIATHGFPFVTQLSYQDPKPPPKRKTK